MSPAKQRSRSRARKPTSPNATFLARILRLHALLVEQRPVTSVALAAELEVAERTIKRDVAFMRDQLGCPIAWDAGIRSYVYTASCDILPLLRLTADEALSLTLAGHTFAAWAGSPLGKALNAALGKIAGVLGGAVSLPATAVGQLVFQPETNPAADSELKHFPILIEAIQRRRELCIHYNKPGAARAERRTIHPLHLAFLDHRWMLIAHDVSRCARRNFLLTRLRAARATGARFEPPADFDITHYLRGSLGRFTGEREWDVRIAFDATAAPYVREHPWHSSQLVESRDDGSIEVTLRLNNLIDVQRRILACGRHAEVLAPPELREAIRNETLLMFGQHSEPPPAWALPNLAAAEMGGLYSQGHHMSQEKE